MKRIKYLSICCIAFFLLTACGSSSSKSGITVKGADGTEYDSYQSACSNGDFDAARVYIGKLKEKRIESQMEDDNKNFDKLIKEAEVYVANEEIQYLASLNDDQASNRIVSILNEQPIEGKESAEMTCLKKNVYRNELESGVWDYDEFYDIIEFDKYIEWCANYNSKCNKVLDIAITYGNQGLAKKILRCFRPDAELLKKDIKGNSGYCDAYAHYTNASKNAAQKKYDESVESGAFN